MTTTPTVTVRGPGSRDGFPDYIVKKLKGDRYGVHKGSVERHWKIGPKNQRVDPKWTDTLYAPDPGWGIPCIDADGECRDSMFITTYSYEGVDNSKTFDPTDDQKTFHFQGTMGDKRLELHPLFAQLKAQFGWDEDAHQFPEFITGSGVSNNSALKVGGKQGERSPLAGYDSWFYVGATYHVSYASQRIPDLLSKIGTLTKSPPNIGKFKLPKAAQKRVWLIMCPDITLRGNSAQVTEEYLLSEPGGLPEAIYNFSQLG